MSLIAGVQQPEFVLLAADLRHWGDASQRADLGGKLVFTHDGWATGSAGQVPGRVMTVALHVAAGTTDGSPRPFFEAFCREFGAAHKAMGNGTEPGPGCAPVLASWSEDGTPRLHSMEPSGSVTRWPAGYVGFLYNDEDAEAVARHEERVAAADGLGEAVRRLAEAFEEVGAGQPRISPGVVIAALHTRDGPTRCSWTGRASEIASRPAGDLLQSAQPFSGGTF